MSVHVRHGRVADGGKLAPPVTLNPPNGTPPANNAAPTHGVARAHGAAPGRSAAPAHSAAPGHRTARARRPSGRRRAMRIAIAVPVTAVLLTLGSVAALWPATPSVADAGARVSTILAAHGGTKLTALPAPDRVGQALIATEDSRFRSTPGVDPVALARIAWSALRGTGDTGGAGLAQQLAKNLYHPGGSGLWGEVQQVELALKLDATYSKDDVLRMYLSAVYYGHGFYGVTEAARGYFG